MDEFEVASADVPSVPVVGDNGFIENKVNYGENLSDTDSGSWEDASIGSEESSEKEEPDEEEEA